MTDLDAYIRILQCIVTDDVVAVEVSAAIGFDYYVATGTSKRDPRDNNNTDIGVRLAMGRAIRQLGRDILHDGQDAVHAADKLRKSQEKAADAARKKKDEKAKKLSKKSKLLYDITTTQP